MIAEADRSPPEEKYPRARSLMKAHAAVAEHPEFQGNVAFFGTRAFWRPQEQSPSGQAYHWNTNAETYYKETTLKWLKSGNTNQSDLPGRLRRKKATGRKKYGGDS